MNTDDTKNSAPDRVRLTERLRLEPIGPRHAKDLWLMHQDDAVARWHGGPWTIEASHRQAAEAADGWTRDGVHKWIAYDRHTGELIGRGGLSRMPADARTTREMVVALGGSSWVDSRLEVGWNLRASHWGHGYATEIGRAGLIFAFDELGASHVVAFTETENPRSRAVMERLDMAYVQEITHDDAPFALYVVGRRDGADEDR